VDIVSAIEYSCNSYFRVLTQDLTLADVSAVAQRLGLQPPQLGSSGLALAGMGQQWQLSPLSIASAYVELARRREQPGIRQILLGMQQSAEYGTGAQVDHILGHPDVLVKTGTAPCTHTRHAPGDGFVIALTPAADPQILLMVRVHGVPGAQAARTAGQMLHRIDE
jgi:cell division protein FtsI/penicillin-binding protein 2